MKSALRLYLHWLCIVLLIGTWLFGDWQSRADETGPGGAAAESSSSLPLPLTQADRRRSEYDPDDPSAIDHNLDLGELSETEQYNRGVELYRAGRIEEAAELFRHASAASDSAVAARSRFNLGNTDYSRALALWQSGEPDALAAAIPLLDAAIDQYRSALRIDASDTDARFNIELAARLKRQLQQRQDEQQQQEQEQEQQQEQEQEQQQGEQQQQQQEQQEPGQQPPSSDQEQQEEQQGAGGQDEPSQGEQQQGRQGESEQAPTEPSESADAGEPESGQPEAGETESAQTPTRTPPSQSPPEPPIGQPDPDDDSSDDSTPQGELTAANESTDSQADESPDQRFDQPMGMTLEEARKMLQSIRDRDLQRRIELQRARRARQIPVERDW